MSLAIRGCCSIAAVMGRTDCLIDTTVYRSASEVLAFLRGIV